MKLSKSALLELSVAIYAKMVEGNSDTEIIEALRLDGETFNEAKHLMYETRAEKLRTMPREHVYIDYVAEQRKNIRDLDDLVRNLDKNNQYNALIGAIRLRSDIQDKIIDRGQEFGVIKKTAQRHEVIAGIAVVDMTVDDLRRGIIDQTKLLKDVMDKYGDKDILSLPPSKTHYAGTPVVVTTGSAVGEEDDEDMMDDMPPPPPKRSTGTHRSKTARRSAGRKRVRE